MKVDWTKILVTAIEQGPAWITAITALILARKGGGQNPPNSGQ